MGCAALVAVGALVAGCTGTGAGPLDPTAPSTPSASPSPEASLTKKELKYQANEARYDWAASLPRGPDAKAVFTYAGTLYAGAQRVPLPQGSTGRGGVLAVLDDGWLIAVPDTAKPGSSISGVLSPGGTFTALRHQAADPLNTGRHCGLVSPDRTRLAGVTEFVSLPAGNRLGPSPRHIRFCDAWTPSGLVYSDTKNRLWLWMATGAPKRLPKVAEAILIQADGYGLRVTEECTEVRRLRPSGRIPVIASMCGIDAKALYDGNRVLTDNYEIYDVAEQAQVVAFDVPDELRGAVDTPVWEGPRSVLFNVTDDNMGGGNTRDGLIVRCRVDTAQCERASRTFTSQNGAPQVLLPLGSDSRR